MMVQIKVEIMWNKAEGGRNKKESGRVMREVVSEETWGDKTWEEVKKRREKEERGKNRGNRQSKKGNNELVEEGSILSKKKKFSHRVSLFKDVTDSLSYCCTEESRRPENPFEGSSLMRSTFFVFFFFSPSVLSAIIHHNLGPQWLNKPRHDVCTHLCVVVCLCVVCMCRRDAWQKRRAWMNISHEVWIVLYGRRPSRQQEKIGMLLISFVCRMRVSEGQGRRKHTEIYAHACLPTLLNHAVRAEGTKVVMKKKGFLIVVECETSSGTEE